MLLRRLLAELFGTFWLVFGGCGSAVFAAVFLTAGDKFNLGIGFVGVSLAFGLTVLTMAYAVGHVSGGHFNPAVTVGLTVGGRFPLGDVVPYIAAQVAGGALAAGVLFVIVQGNPKYQPFDPNAAGVFATNGYADQSPGKYSLAACATAEVVLTAAFLVIILGSTDKRAPAGFAPIPIGLGLTLIHLIGIPITNLSVNPARSTGPALFVGGQVLTQLWLFWLAPVAGAVLGALLYRVIGGTDEKGA